jgi:deoxycytidylate deaminase
VKISDLANLSTGMRKAYEASLHADHPTFRLGCVIMIKGNRIIAEGANDKYRSHPYVQKHGQWFNHGIHAELAAIFRVKNRENLRGATVYIFRQTKNGDFANARPCPMCYELIKNSGVKRIIYTVENGIAEEKVK